MRVTTDLWVSALLRRVFTAGGFAAVVKRGATEAGAVFVLSRDRLGEVALYGPAPQTSYDSAKPDERFFTLLDSGDDSSAFDARLEKEKRFDPDIWVVEIEAGSVPVEELVSVKAE
ncbi:MAG: DUF1491 family protein [Mesorhizobium sp.]|uniref:DUF1491 family protein n=1 Tax=unclassified Mesorhizobium TaxID=325217 RepID=UPI0007FE8D04|nr:MULTISPECIES: DUF1491 family protein [unclassified Mesorhizobium]TGV91648.1 DUF1491 family protein [Mesorhizobium sp. M00.F.Ca.ET.158.01.1.1]MDG4854667.1 DUF1491 family protein [Mesorhizobium sp. WSM4982]MDG4889532.1 DUF1491 family protein [Mesorhizobium sp. WSM4887]MDG4900615.1 DUF1491 family protein [Mesorhizobium sp. WSM4962]MDG4908649.1 DUF1491 family protein [Mesorhizobium sp. WSM4898]